MASGLLSDHRIKSSPPLRVIPRRGFTLVELLVVIAIIAVLIGLLLPAVQKIRESAARTKCENQVKQLALACHLYHDGYQHFPAGVSTNAPNITTVPTQGYAPWSVMILPYLEQGDRYAAFNTATGTFYGLTPGTGADSTASQTAYQSVLNPSFECPSSPHQGINYNTNYFAIQGGGASGASPGIYDLDSGGTWTQRFLSDNGIMFPNSSISAAAIQGGTSNTFLIGETRYAQLESGQPEYYSSWASGFYIGDGAVSGPFFVTGAVTMNAINSGNCDPSATNCGNASVSMTTLGSFHPSGAVFAMADGSVHFVLQSINLSLYQSLGNRNGGGELP